MLSERRTPAATSAELHALEAEAEELIAADVQEDVGEILARLQPWSQQITLRGMCIGVVLAFLFTVVSFKLVLGPGVSDTGGEEDLIMLWKTLVLLHCFRSSHLGVIFISSQEFWKECMKERVTVTCEHLWSRLA